MTRDLLQKAGKQYWKGDQEHSRIVRDEGRGEGSGWNSHGTSPPFLSGFIQLIPWQLSPCKPQLSQCLPMTRELSAEAQAC